MLVRHREGVCLESSRMWFGMYSLPHPTQACSSSIQGAQMLLQEVTARGCIVLKTLFVVELLPWLAERTCAAVNF